MTINELAQTVAKIVNPESDVVIKGVDTTENMTWYVPSIERVCSQLRIKNHVDLDESIKRTALWWQQAGFETRF